MSDTVMLALIASVPPTIAAIAALLVGFSNSRKADVITGHVNSAAAASTAKIDGLEKEIVLLRSVVADKKETAALLAQTAAEKLPVSSDRRTQP